MTKQQKQLPLIVVPTFNHTKTLGPVLEDLLGTGLSILVVNDGSEDGIQECLARFPQVSVLHHPENQGKGAAIANGMRYASQRGHPAILTFDADGQHLASDVKYLIEAHQRDPSAIIIGARDFVSASSGDIPGSSKFGRKFSNFWVWVETGKRLPDTQTGLRIYPCDMNLLAAIKSHRYAFEIEILTKALWRGLTITSVNTAVYYPDRKERVSHFKAWHDNYSALARFP